jgi:hypothetical protein
MVVSPAMPDENAIPTPSGRLSPTQAVVTISENGMYRSITGADYYCTQLTLPEIA